MEEKQQPLKKAGMIKKYIEQDSDRKVTVAEMLEFKKSCTSDEWTKYAEDASKILGIPLEVS